MADTNLAKSKNGYGYKYTELAQINEYIESIGGSYYQFIETDQNGNDYIMTVKVDKDGKESHPLRGCRVISSNTLQGKSNAAQEMGSGITYARRYSLLMAYGLATEDDDAACITQKTQSQNKGGYKVNKPTAKDVEAIAKDVAANLTPETDKEKCIRIFKSLDEKTQNNILSGLGLDRIENIVKQADIDKLFNNYIKWGIKI